MLLATLFVVMMGATDAEPQTQEEAPTVLEQMEERRERRQKLRAEWRENSASQQEVFMVRAVEGVLSRVLDAPVELESLRLDAKSGQVALDGLRIGNPKGFSDSGDAILMDTAVLEADPKLLFSEEPIIHLIEATGVTVNAETSLKGNNLKELLDNAKRLTGKQPSALEKLGQKPEKTWRIEKGVLGGVTLNLITTLLSKQTTQKTIEPIEMSFLGEDGKGMTASQAMAKVLQRILDETGILPRGDGESSLGGLLGGLLNGNQ